MKKLNCFEKFFLGGTLGTTISILAYFIANILICNNVPVMIKYLFIILGLFILWGLIFLIFYNFFYKISEKNKNISHEKEIKNLNFFDKMVSFFLIILVVHFIFSLIYYDFFMAGIVGLAILALLFGFIGARLMKKKLEKDVIEINNRL